ncbi:hypothetical protein HK102_010892, partial [Quaeritorhiza haematococci]
YLDDTLPTLFDLNISVLKISQHHEVDCWNFYWGPLVDRVRACSFLHHLISIDFDGSRNLSGNTESTIVQDAIHKKLRKINFGTSFDSPLNLLSAPHHLTVLCAPYVLHPKRFFRIIADHCPHLRALSCPDLHQYDPPDDWPLVESFRYFMRRRGAQLVALEFSMAQGDIEPLFEATLQECRLLEYFGLEDPWDRLHPEQLNSFLSQCSNRLKYLAICVKG